MFCSCSPFYDVLLFTPHTCVRIYMTGFDNNAHTIPLVVWKFMSSWWKTKLAARYDLFWDVNQTHATYHILDLNHTHTHTHARTHARTAHTRTHTHARTHTHSHTYTYTYNVCTHILIQLYACTHAYTHRHTHKHCMVCVYVCSCVCV